MYLFLCDGKVEGCLKTNCFKQGGVCYRTTDVQHAVNFQKRSNLDEVFYEEKMPFVKNMKYKCSMQSIMGWLARFRLKIRLLLLNRF